MNKILLLSYMFIFYLPPLASANAIESASATIINGTDWKDTTGKPIAAHEGDIARFNGVFYWYGSSYAGNPKGKFDVSDGPVWNGVQVYSSTDLKNWTYKGVCLPRPENGFGELGATGRAHVIYNEKTKKYVMWYRWYLHVPASFLMVATADHPEGPFTSLGVRQMGTSNGFASDMNVFKDDDGKAYVIYCDHGEHGVKGSRPLYAIRIDSLSDDYLTSNQDGALVFDRGCEAPAMVKYKGKYIAVASGVHGWAGSETVCAIADSPLGKYKKQEDVSVNKTWNSQVTDLIYLKESDTVMALCDQWWIPDKSDINKSRYLFLELHLDPQTGKAKIKYHEKWNPLGRDGKAFVGTLDDDRISSSSRAAAVNAPLLVPRPSKPWDDSLRIVGYEDKFHNDFTLIKDGEGSWHCIGSGGREGSLDTLFHAVGTSLNEPFDYLPKITSQTDPKAIHMWAPFAIRKDDETVYLYFSHLRGPLDKYMKDRDLWDWGTQFELRLMVSRTPDLRTWKPCAAPSLDRDNVVFRAPTVRDPCIFWDEQHQRYFMYYSAVIPTTGGDGGLEGAIRVRTSKDMIYWSAARTAMTTPPGYTNAESAFVLPRDGLYYLWVCGYDYGRMSLYISETPFYFGGPVDNRIMEQSGHTPEIVTEKGVDYMACAHIGPGNLEGSPSVRLFGVRIQPIAWSPANSEEVSKVYRNRQNP